MSVKGWWHLLDNTEEVRYIVEKGQDTFKISIEQKRHSKAKRKYVRKYVANRMKKVMETEGWPNDVVEEWERMYLEACECLLQDEIILAADFNCDDTLSSVSISS